MPENCTPPAHSPNNTAVICARIRGERRPGDTEKPGIDWAAAIKRLRAMLDAVTP